MWLRKGLYSPDDAQIKKREKNPYSRSLQNLLDKPIHV